MPAISRHPAVVRPIWFRLLCAWRGRSLARAISVGRLLIGAAALTLLVGCSAPGGGIVAHPRPSATPSPTPSPTPTPLPTATVALPLTFVSDPLQSPNTNGWPEDPGRCFFGGDGYHVAQFVTCPAPFGTWTNFTISVTAQQVAGGSSHGYGLMLRIQPNTQQDSYVFEVYAGVGQWAFWKTVNGTAAVMQGATPSSAINTGAGAANILRVEANGNQFHLFVNDTPLAVIVDNSPAPGNYPSGFVGLGVFGDVEAVFTHFSLKAE